MVFTDDVTDDARRFLVRLVVVVAQLAHGMQHAPVDRLQAVAHVRQRTPDDYAHGVIEIGLLHLVFETDRQNFLCDFRHTNPACLCVSGKSHGIAAAKLRVIRGKNP